MADKNVYLMYAHKTKSIFSDRSSVTALILLCNFMKSNLPVEKPTIQAIVLIEFFMKICVKHLF